MPDCTLDRAIRTQQESVAELAITTLSRLGWDVRQVNQSRRQITARRNETQRVAGAAAPCDYQMVIRWRPSPQGVVVSVSVSERKNNWSGARCLDSAAECLDALEADAALMEETGAQEDRPTLFGSARWAEPGELEQEGYAGGVGEPDRLVLGFYNGKPVSAPPADTARHALVCGPTGCGKTTGVFIPNLLERADSSAIVTEATAGDELPDLYAKTAGFRYAFGKQEIFYFNPGDMRSVQINPIDQVRSVDDAQTMASLIIQNTTTRQHSGDPIWETSERHLLAALILHVVGEKGHLGMVRWLMTLGPDRLNQILSQSRIEEARQEYRAFYMNSTEGFRFGVTSGLMQRLNLWVSPRVVKLTERTSFDLRKLSEQLFTFYVAVPAHKTHLKPVAALVFNFIVNLALEHEFKHPLFLALDEFTNFGYLPGITEKLTIIRHRNIPAMLGVQDFVQIKKLYKEDAVLLFSQPGTRIFYRPRDFDTAKKISESLGTQTVLDRKVTSSGQIVEREYGRPLLAPADLLSLDQQKVIAFTSATRPLLLDRIGWERYGQLTKIQPPARTELKVSESLKRVCDKAGKKPGWLVEYEREHRKRPSGEPKKDRNRYKERDLAQPKKGRDKPRREPSPAGVDMPPC